MEEKFKKIFKVITNILFALLLVTIFLVGISLVPFPQNFKIFTVSSGSMKPKIKTGSLVVVRPLNKYFVNDIITVKTKDPKKTVTHRLINIKKEGEFTIFETKGDANNAKDFEKIYQKDIIGKVLFSVPYLGYPISYSKTLQGLIFMIIIPATIIIYSEILNIKNEAIRLIKE